MGWKSQEKMKSLTYIRVSILLGFIGAVAVVTAFQYPYCINIPEWVYDLQALGMALFISAPHFGLIGIMKYSRNLLNRLRYVTIATSSAMYATSFNAVKEIFSMNCDNSVFQLVLFFSGLAIITIYHYARATEHSEK